jgi:hypothetical protein
MWGDPDARVPQAFTAVIGDPDLENPAIKVTLEAELDGERPRCRRLQVEAAGAGEITGDVLRRIPVTSYLLQALSRLAFRRHEVADLPDWIAEGLAREGISETLMPAAQEDQRAVYEAFANKARRPRRGSPVTDEHLGQVAELYRAAVQRGDNPTQTIADTMHAARSTAARWVGLARKRGLLGASLPGRAGEVQVEIRGED